ncbi:MAG: hypothetical protein OEW64_02255 [Gammaproteobacteria bacterium]|nr:hypothetical protein [Gammaproteobacteria bacterium]MDH5302903.1 hypothetical protein [Gammaproteobacteria bacterium]MDH5321008.1 hypothetical protein [Gammaproteobacteria bacterium]
MSRVRSTTVRRAIAFAALCLGTAAYGQEYRLPVAAQNIDLQEGAAALLAGDADEGVKKTLAGLKYASNRNDRLTGTSNLCAGYILLARYEDALQQCEKVLAEDPDHWRALTNRALINVLQGSYDKAELDLDRAEELAPQALSIKNVRSLLRDRREPVEPIIIIDDRD